MTTKRDGPFMDIWHDIEHDLRCADCVRGLMIDLLIAEVLIYFCLSLWFGWRSAVITFLCHWLLNIFFQVDKRIRRYLIARRCGRDCVK